LYYLSPNNTLLEHRPIIRFCTGKKNEKFQILWFKCTLLYFLSFKIFFFHNFFLIFDKLYVFIIIQLSELNQRKRQKKALVSLSKSYKHIFNTSFEFVPLSSRYRFWPPLLTIPHRYYKVIHRLWPSMTVYVSFEHFFTAFNRFYWLPSVLIDLRTINNP